MSSIKIALKSGLSSVLDWIDAQVPSEELRLKNYSSVAAFYVDACRILALNDGKEELRTTLVERLVEAFPWFNHKSAPIHSTPTTTNNNMNKDHDYAATSTGLQPKALHEFTSPFERIYEPICDDGRRCGFCRALGDSDTCGRLLPLRGGDFVHVNCALWSSEVIESTQGGLSNVSLALGRASKLTCSYCREKGASSGCWNKGCSKSYHFSCALRSGAAYKKDMSLYCPSHSCGKEDYLCDDLSVSRLLYVNAENTRKKTSKFVNLSTICFQVGSLTVEKLGFLKPGVSDSPSALIPLNLKCSRLYWSVKDPLKVVKYHCRTRLVKNDSKVPPAPEPSFCFNHETQQQPPALQKALSTFNRILLRHEMRQRNWALSGGIILHPYAVSSKWNNITYRDLHKKNKDLLPIKMRRVPKKGRPSFKRQFNDYWNNKKKQLVLSVLKENAAPVGGGVYPPLERQSECRPMQRICNSESILQVDGAADDFRLACPKCKRSVGDVSLYEGHVSACKGPKRVSEGNSGGYPLPPKTPRGEASSSSHEEISPRKDFSIEGLLSPPERSSQGATEEEGNPIIVDGDDDDDVVIISQTRSKPPKKKVRKVSSAPNLKQQQQQQNFPYDPRSRSTTLHCVNPYPLFQPTYYPYMQPPPQQPSHAQFSYVTPAGYIFNQNSFFQPPPTQQSAAAIYFNHHQQQNAAYSQNPLFRYSLPPPLPSPSLPNVLTPSHLGASSTSGKSKKKIARVHPQPVVSSSSLSSSSVTTDPNPSMDPIKALSNMVPARNNLKERSVSSSSIALSHPADLNKPSISEKLLLPSPSSAGIESTSLIKPKVETVSLPSDNESVFCNTLSNGAQFSYETSAAKETSIQIVFQRSQESLRVESMSLHNSDQSDVQPKVASDLLKQLKASRKKKRKLAFVSMKDEMINEVEANMAEPSSFSPQLWRPHELTSEMEDDAGGEYKVLYELSSEDGFKAVSCDVNELWKQVFDAVQDARMDRCLNPIPTDAIRSAGLQMLGLTHNALSFILEQMPEGAMSMERYTAKHGKKPHEALPPKENPSGCARTEMFSGRSPLDMFSWLASKHRKKPDLSPSSKVVEFESISANRRATSLDLPIAMRFRHLAKNAKEAVGVFNSGIHGRGLYCKREIQEGEMVIEYAGEEIRAVLADKREKYYESRGIGCYMFRVDDNTVIDATLKGNAARFINHCCDPNCYSKIVDVVGKKHIIIFALRTIIPGEELTYDYKFPIEDVKLPCTCGKKKCRKYMN